MAERTPRKGDRLQADFDPGLRLKYEQLTRKYASLVARLELREEEKYSEYRLGWLGLQASDSALALVSAGKIHLSNPRWAELDTPGAWELLAREGQPRTYPDLRALTLGEAGRADHPGAMPLIQLFRHANDHRVIETRIERLGNPGAKPMVVLFALDVSERVRGEEELARTREALFQKEHLRVLGELSAAVAHDLGSTLRSMEMRLIALEKLRGKTPVQEEAVVGLRESVASASASVRALAEIARSGRLIIGPVDLKTIIEHALAVLRMELRHSGAAMRVVTELGRPPLVEGTVPELTHLFTNLLRNARDAMPDGGTVRVVAEVRRRRLFVEVIDEGKGFAPSVIAHLFEAFFTTKGQAGTGLGLWLASTTMHRLGGTISAKNRDDGARGAIVTVEFPLGQSAQVATRPSAPLRSRG